VPEIIPVCHGEKIMSSTPKEALVRRIRALLSKTVENGATEAEAMSALEKAADIMRAHGLDREAIEAEAFVRETFSSKAASRGFYWGHEIGYAVSLFTGTFSYYPDGDKTKLVFAGRESDTMFAFWLTDALDAFVTRAAASYINECGGARATGTKRVPRVFGQADMFGGSAVTQRDPNTDARRNAMIRDFGLGVCARIAERLVELATDETRRRRQDAQRKLESEGYSFNKSKAQQRRVGDYGAYAAGQSAGNGASFGRPINGGAGVRQIGRA
jgi:Protein of unknown function (DUF2786)